MLQGPPPMLTGGITDHYPLKSIKTLSEILPVTITLSEMGTFFLCQPPFAGAIEVARIKSSGTADGSRTQASQLADGIRWPSGQPAHKSSSADGRRWFSRTCLGTCRWRSGQPAHIRRASLGMRR